MLWSASDIVEDDLFMNRFGQMPGDEGYGFQHEYVEGNMIYQHVHSDALTSPTGIPGLHDGSGNFKGYGKNETDYTDITIGLMPEIANDNTLIVLSAKDFAGGHLKNLQEGVVVKVDGSELAEDKFTVNHEKGQINITANAGEFAEGAVVTATYRAYHYGVDSYLDYKGVEGAMFVLLKR